MAAPRDATHSIKNCRYCGVEFDPSEKKKISWMNITPSKDNPLIHVALCDECYEKDGIHWVGERVPKYEVS